MDRVSESPIDNTASNIVEEPSSGRTPQGRAQRQSFDFCQFPVFIGSNSHLV